MSSSFKKSAILIIKGLTFEELNAVEQIIIKEENKFKYNTIPKEFKSVEEWPKYTNLLCWHCDRTVIGYPKFIPKNPTIINKNDTCEIIGNFDRWECAVAYAYKEFSKEVYFDTLMNIKIFATKFHPNIKTILPAPSKTLMKQYCGDSGITAEQYEEMIEKKMREIENII
jgi:hypothetical protein